MSIEAYEPPPGLFGRIKRLIGDPPAAWDQIAREETPPGALLSGHVAPLAVAMALAGVLGAMLAAGFVFEAETLIVQPAAALIRLVLAVAGVVAFARLADALAPRFGATPNPARAMQLSAYGATGVLLAGLTMIAPVVAPYGIATGVIFSMVLVYIGLPRMMQVSEGKRIGYFWSMIGAALVAALLLSYAYGAAMDGVRALSRDIKIGEVASAPPEAAAPALAPGAAFDASALQRFGDSTGGARAAPDALGGFLPPSLPGGFVRMSLAHPASVGAPQAQAVYARGDAHLVVTITHLGLRGAPAAIEAAQRALTPRQDAAGYARHQITGGRLVAESLTGDALGYTIIGRALAVSIAGSGGATMDDARAAVDTIGMLRLEGAFPR